MDKEKVLDYVMNSPGNSNRAVLSGILDSFAGESGGDSDFSIAQITINGTINGVLPVCHDHDENGMGVLMVLDQSHSGIKKIPLYKGSLLLAIYGVSSISGNIQDMGGDMYYITGDCTITMSE